MPHKSESSSIRCLYCMMMWNHFLSNFSPSIQYYLFHLFLLPSQLPLTLACVLEDSMHLPTNANMCLAWSTSVSISTCGEGGVFSWEIHNLPIIPLQLKTWSVTWRVMRWMVSSGLIQAVRWSDSTVTYSDICGQRRVYSNTITYMHVHTFSHLCMLFFWWHEGLWYTT